MSCRACDAQCSRRLLKENSPGFVENSAGERRSMLARIEAPNGCVEALGNPVDHLGARQASGPGFRIDIPLKERSGVYDLRLFSTGVWDDRSI